LPEEILKYVYVQYWVIAGYQILEAIRRWSAICRVWPWTLTYQKFLLCISSQGQNLYSHQKLSMYIYWFSSESGYRRPAIFISMVIPVTNSCFAVLLDESTDNTATTPV